MSVKSRILKFQAADSRSELSASTTTYRRNSAVSERIRELNSNSEDVHGVELRRSRSKSPEKFLETPSTTIMASKKASLSINLTGNTTTNGNKSPRNSLNNETKVTTSQPEFLTTKLKSPALRSRPFLSPVSNSANNANNNSRTLNGTGTGRSSRNDPLVLSTPTVGVTLRRAESKVLETNDWDDRHEECERRRLHVVTLAQKATRDYEELRRRYQDSIIDRERMSQKLVNATAQLEVLRRASEAAYDEYYKLKKKYDNEFHAKSEALSRVDQYTKENKRLKRQSAIMLQHIDDPSKLLQESAEENAEDDKELAYLRKRVQELQGRVVELESELEKTRLTEFETQESVMLMNDAVKATKSETSTLREQIQKLEEENRRLVHSLDDTRLELDTVKSKDALEQAKLQTAQSELQKVRMEKNILQRQSLVFMNDEMDDKLMGALDQIKDLQTVIEQDKNNFQKQIQHLHRCLTEKETEEETNKIKWEAKVKALEDEVKFLRERAEIAEEKLEENGGGIDAVQPPPPPAPPAGLMAPPPPPPPPLPSLLPASMGSSMASQINSTKLKKTLENGSNDSLLEDTKAPPLDDIVNQIKKGIKLRSVDRTISKKPSEIPGGNKTEDHAVEEMRAILNNLKRRQRIQ